MRFSNIFLFAVILLLTHLPAVTRAQQAPSQISSQKILTHFDQIFRVDSRLISGNFYQDLSPRSTDGHPYYGDQSWNIGSVVIDNISFDSLLLRYDIYNNELICNPVNFTNSLMPLALNKDRISSFTMNGRRFLPFPSPETGQKIRFSEVLASGPVTLLLLQSKKLKVPISGNFSFAYETYSTMTLLVDNKIIKYKGKQTLYRLYPQLKIPLQAFIRSQKLRLPGKQHQNHARLIDYCNTLLAHSE